MYAIQAFRSISAAQGSAKALRLQQKIQRIFTAANQHIGAAYQPAPAALRIQYGNGKCTAGKHGPVIKAVAYTDRLPLETFYDLLLACAGAGPGKGVYPGA